MTRTITWCNVPGESNRVRRGIRTLLTWSFYRLHNTNKSILSTTSPIFPNLAIYFLVGEFVICHLGADLFSCRNKRQIFGGLDLKATRVVCHYRRTSQMIFMKKIFVGGGDLCNPQIPSKYILCFNPVGNFKKIWGPSLHLIFAIWTRVKRRLDPKSRRLDPKFLLLTRYNECLPVFLRLKSISLST
jgi:hypothetical protein